MSIKACPPLWGQAFIVSVLFLLLRYYIKRINAGA